MSPYGASGRMGQKDGICMLRLKYEHCVTEAGYVVFISFQGFIGWWRLKVLYRTGFRTDCRVSNCEQTSRGRVADNLSILAWRLRSGNRTCAGGNLKMQIGDHDRLSGEDL
jgi:hypothetical protein